MINMVTCLKYAVSVIGEAKASLGRKYRQVHNKKKGVIAMRKITAIAIICTVIAVMAVTTATAVRAAERFSSYGPGKNLVYRVTESDKLWIAKVIYVMDRNGSYRSKAAIGALVLNRWKSGKFGRTIKAVVTQKNAFLSVKNVKDEQARSCMKVVEAVLRGYDPTRAFFSNGALYMSKDGSAWKTAIAEKIGRYYYSDVFESIEHNASKKSANYTAERPASPDVKIIPQTTKRPTNPGTTIATKVPSRRAEPTRRKAMENATRKGTKVSTSEPTVQVVSVDKSAKSVPVKKGTSTRTVGNGKVVKDRKSIHTPTAMELMRALNMEPREDAESTTTTTTANEKKTPTESVTLTTTVVESASKKPVPATKRPARKKTSRNDPKTSVKTEKPLNVTTGVSADKSEVVSTDIATEKVAGRRANTLTAEEKARKRESIHTPTALMLIASLDQIAVPTPTIPVPTPPQTPKPDPATSTPKPAPVRNTPTEVTGPTPAPKKNSPTKSRRAINGAISSTGPAQFYVYDITEYDEILIASVVYAEARGECWEGKVAVAAVIFNRWMAGFAPTISGVIYQKSAFASIKGVSRKQALTCLSAVRAARAGYDPTRKVFRDGAKFFFAFKTICRSEAAKREGVLKMRIGNHDFHNSFNKNGGTVARKRSGKRNPQRRKA